MPGHSPRRQRKYSIRGANAPLENREQRTVNRRGGRAAPEKDCQNGEPQITQIGADLGPATAGRTARLFWKSQRTQRFWLIGRLVDWMWGAAPRPGKGRRPLNPGRGGRATPLRSPCTPGTSATCQLARRTGDAGAGDGRRRRAGKAKPLNF